MTADHERAQEILAGHALHSLTDLDRSRAAELLSSHVPGCEQCRLAQESFTLVAGDLALAGGWVEPPRPLRARLRRDRAARRWGRRRQGMTVAAVALVLLGGLAAWNTHLAARVSQAERAQALEAEVIATVSQPESQVIPLTSSVVGMAGSRVAAAFVPGRRSLYLFGSLPTLPRHRVYQVWLRHGATYDNGGSFQPTDTGRVCVRVAADPSTVDGVVVTEGPAGSDAPAPPQGGQGVVSGDL
jgi:hypothetical protein